MHSLDDLILKYKPKKLIHYKDFKKIGETEMKDCDYEEMTKSVGGQSQPQPYHDEPMINSYENTRKSFYGEDGVDWSGMKGNK